MAYCSNEGSSINLTMGGCDIGLAISGILRTEVWDYPHVQLAFNANLGFKEVIMDPSLLHVLMVMSQSLLVGWMYRWCGSITRFMFDFRGCNSLSRSSSWKSSSPGVSPKLVNHSIE